MIQPPKKLYRPIGQPPDLVSCPIEPRPWRLSPRVGDKLLSRQLRPMQIPSCQTNPPDVQFSCYPNWDRLKAGIKHIELHVGNGKPNGNAGTLTVSLTGPGTDVN